MLYKTLSLAILSSIAHAAVTEVQWVADSSETSVNGLGLSSIHEGAGINYFLLGSDSETLKFDEETGTVYANLTDTITQFVSINLAKILELSVLEPQKVTVADGVVSVNGTDSFFACKNINDPYRYTEKSFAILNKNGDGCFPMKIKVKSGETSSTSSSSSSSSTASSSTSAPTISTTSGNGAVAKNAGSVVGAVALIAALL